MIAFAEVLNEDFPVTSNLYLTSLHNNIVSQVIRQRPLRKHLKLGCQGLNIWINADKYKALPDFNRVFRKANSCYFVLIHMWR